MWPIENVDTVYCLQTTKSKGRGDIGHGYLQQGLESSDTPPTLFRP